MCQPQTLQDRQIITTNRWRNKNIQLQLKNNSEKFPSPW